MTALRTAILRGARSRARPGAATRGARPGDGLVFSQLRAYVEGDDPRRIDHAATARVGTLQTRVYLEENALVLAAILDESGSMRVGRQRPLRAAGYDALRAWFGALEHEDVAARIVDGRVVRDRRAAPLIEARESFAFATALTLALRALPRGASLLAIGDGFDLPAGDLLARAGLRFDATALLARDPWLDDLPLAGFVRLRDAESGRVHRAYIDARMRARYRSASRAREASLHARFAQAGWRTGVLDEADGRGSLLRAFGMPG